MTCRRRVTPLLFYMTALLAIFAMMPEFATGQIERQNNNLQITAVDAADFPTVSVRVLTTTTGGAPITDQSRLILRENGVPITETTAAQVPVGVDLALVVDANTDFLQFDDRSGLNRRDKLAASVARYTAQFMDPAGLDRVSVVVPADAEESPLFLAQDVARPGELAEALAAYTPAAPRATPLQAMLAAAIEHLASTEGGRFRAVLLFTDGARLDRQLDFQSLVEQAQAANVLLYAAILGAEASPEEIANVTRLTDPANGLYIHMPEPEATDPLYAIFQAQSRQAELSYRSDLRENGAHEVSVSIGNVRASAGFELELAAPEVTLESSSTAIRRVGMAPDTPLTLLQPAVLPLTVRVSWPDGQPRRLVEFTFNVNGVAQPVAVEPAPDAAGQLPLPWDISERDQGVYTLDVAIVDEFGFRAQSAPLEIDIDVARPSPPTPTPAPTPVSAAILGASDDVPWPLLIPALAAGAMAGFWLWRRARRKAVVGASDPLPKITPASGPPADDRHVAVLAWLNDAGEIADQIDLTAADVTLGREPDEVDVVIEDPSISRLHARIRRNQAGEHWLFDEGSIMGTYLNYERLGLAPRQLQHGDVVQLGRVTLRFRLELPSQAADDRPQTTDDR